MKLQGNYIIHREAFGEQYTFRVHKTYEQYDANTILVDAVVVQYMEPHRGEHLLVHGIQHIAEELFHTVEDTAIHHTNRSYTDGSGDHHTPIFILKAVGRAVLTEDETQYVLQQEQDNAETLAELSELRESILDLKDEEEELTERLRSVQDKITSQSMKFDELEEAVQKSKYASERSE